MTLASRRQPGLAAHPSPRPGPAQAVLALSLLALVGCGAEEEAAPAAETVVVVEPVTARRLEVRIQATGELQAVEQAVIAAEIEGRVTEVLHDEGDSAAQGDVLLRIDPERRKLAVASAEASLREARAARREAVREHARVLKLQARGAASSQQLDSAATTLEAASSRLAAAEAHLGEAERALSDAEVRAPFQGVVDRRLVGRGEYVGAGSPLFELVANDPLEVVFHLSEADSARVALDNPVAVQVASHPEERFTARVSMIAPTIDSRTRTLRVKAELANSDGRLRSGLFARVDLGVAVREGVSMVAEESVLQRAAGPIVFVMGDGGRAEKRTIETGVHMGGEVEVVSGLDVGDWVITQGHSRLVDGMRTKPLRKDGSPFDTRLARSGPGGGAVEGQGAGESVP